MTSASGGPLEGVRVIDMTRALAGPYCTMLLADMGADVIKVERPTGDHVRGVGPFAAGDSLRAYGGYFQSVNRNKRSVVVDLKNPAGANVIRKLVADADVLVENFRPGVMDRLGLSYESLSALNPRLVYGSLNGFGSPRAGASPYSSWPSYDIVSQSMGGLVGITGEPGAPTKAGPGVGDVFPAALLANGILGALVKVRSGGKGQFVDVSMYDAILSLCERIVYQHSYAGINPKPTGSHHPFFAPFGLFETADGHVAVAAHHDRSWVQLVDIMGRPELLADPDYATTALRGERKQQIDSMLEAWTKGFTTREVFESSLGGRVPVAPVHLAADIFADEHVAARDMLIELDHPGLDGRPKVAGTAIKFEEPRRTFHRAPLLGEHTVAALTEAGVAADELAALLEGEVVAAHGAPVAARADSEPLD